MVSEEVVSIQELDPGQLDEVVAITNALYPDYPSSPEEYRHWIENWDYDKYLLRLHVAVGPEGTVVGFTECGHSPSVFHPRKFWFEISVRPDWQRRGIGGLLYDNVLNTLSEHDPVEYRTGVRENMDAGIRFVESRGYRETMRAWQSDLDLTTFDAEPFRRHLDGLDDVEITTIGEERSSQPDLYRRIHALGTEIMRDVPLPGRFTPVDYEFFLRLFESPGFLPEGFFLAKAGDEYVGQCQLEKLVAEEATLEHGLTGVTRDHRGRGLAMALKVAALEWAKEAGYKLVKTFNDSTNEGMLAINEKLGFVRRPAWITYTKRLGESEDE